MRIFVRKDSNVFYDDDYRYGRVTVPYLVLC